MAELAALGAVDTLDMKGHYDDVCPSASPTTPGTYERVARRASRDAWIEDPRLTPELARRWRGHEHRVTWDAPIHSVADVRALEWTPRMINVKPSRFGPLSRLFADLRPPRGHGIGAYGGGQTELGPGRGQIQYLASLFHPDAPNDTAPGGYNDPVPPPGPPRDPAAGRGLADRLPLGLSDGRRASPAGARRPARRRARAEAIARRTGRAAAQHAAMGRSDEEGRRGEAAAGAPPAAAGLDDPRLALARGGR